MLGWSAEDDIHYRFPDRKFYPAGTIKVNFGSAFISILAILNDHSFSMSSDVREGAREFKQLVIFHELVHAKQYHRHPVRSFETLPGSIVDGIADPRTLESTLEKIEYEHEAFRRSRKVLNSRAAGALAASLEEYALRHPDEFRAGGKYERLHLAKTSAFLRTESSLRTSNEFSKYIHVIIDGQAEVPRTVLELKKLNDRLEHRGRTSRENAISSATKEFEAIEARYAEFMNTESSAALRQVYSYIPAVENRHAREVQRFRALTHDTEAGSG